MLALTLMSSSLPPLSYSFFSSSLLFFLPFLPFFSLLFKLASHLPSTILLSSYLLFILLPFPLPSPYLPFLLTPLHFHPSSHLFSPLPLICSLTSLHPTPPPSSPSTSISPYLNSPTSILLPPFSLTLYILSNLHVPPIFFPLSPSHAVAHLQVQWVGCGTRSTSPAALATSN